MVLFNFTIYYRPGVKMGHMNFILKIDTFLSKNSTNTSISTLRIQKLLEYLQLKWIRIPIVKYINPKLNKK